MNLNANTQFLSSIAPLPSYGRCDDCKNYRWYYDRCEKWGFEVDHRAVRNCWEKQENSDE